MSLDPIDLRILTALQSDATLTAAELSEKLNLSGSQAGRRKQRLEAEGYISGYGARLNASQLGLDVQAFIQVELARHSSAVGEDFRRLILKRDEVVSAWSLTGPADYLLRVYTRDLTHLNMLIHDVILRHSAVARAQSQIVMDQPKADAGLPL